MHAVMSPPGSVRAVPSPTGPKPLVEGTQSVNELVVLWVFVVAPFVALLAAIPLAWGWGVSTLDIVVAGIGYLIAITGVTVGFHRHLTHGSFKARRPLRIALAVAGSLAVEGAPTKWVADHRRHHAFTDREGDRTLPGVTVPASSPWPKAFCTRTAAGCSTGRSPTRPASRPICSPTAASASSTGSSSR